MMSLTAALVESVRSFAAEAIPDEALEAAGHCLLDWLGCALAGSTEPLVRMLVDELVGAASEAPSTVLGPPPARRAMPAIAALVNGAAGHALDYDDTHMTMSGHPTAPVAPAVLALAEQIGASGREVLHAVVVGIETEGRLGLLLGGHYEAGWHATGTIGTFGAAAACAHLLALSTGQWLHAFGLAGTQAAGVKGVFGTMSKPLHAGKAAQNGLMAAVLAKRGFTSATDIIGMDQGFGHLHSATVGGADVLEAAAGRWFVRETLFKYHAACYLTHSAITATQQLVCLDGVDPQAVDHVEIEAHRSLFNVCNIQSPTTGLEGKFSLRTTAAMAVLGIDTSDTSMFSDAIVNRPDVVALRDRVTVVESHVGQTVAAVSVRQRDGREHRRSYDSGVPADDLAEQWPRLVTKFRGLAAPIIGDARAEAMIEAVRSIDMAPSVASIMGTSG